MAGEGSEGRGQRPGVNITETPHTRTESVVA